MRIALLLISLLLPSAAADEATSNCEEGQPWIGYKTTDELRELWYRTLDPEHRVNACEGEQWDGQDAVRGSEDPGAACTLALPTGLDDVFVGYCMSSDPNRDRTDVLQLRPAVFRASYRGDGASSQEAYAAADVDMVATFAIFLGACDAGGDLEGRACAERSARSAVYARDGTPGNLVLTLLRPPSIINPVVPESDCDQATYQSGQYQRDHRCGRDNTAFTVELLP